MNARALSSTLGILLSLSVAACSSTSGGSATGTAGTSGSAGATAGVSGDAAAGSSGDAAGVAGATGTAGMGAGADASACPYAPSLGAVTILTLAQTQTQLPMASEVGDRSTTTEHDSVSWLGPINNNTRPDVLDVQLYKSKAPFGAMLAPMSISLAGQNDFATCGACVLFHPVWNDGAPLHAQTNYIAKSGTLNITAVVPNGNTTQLTATLSNVVFEHVTIDSSFVTTKIDDCTITLTSATIATPATP